MPNDITPGTTFTLNQQNINAPTMNAITGSAVINPSFVSSKPSATSMASADTLLMYSQSAQVLKQVPYSTLSSQIQGTVQTGVYNALHNGDMAVNQNGIVTPTTALFTTLDRWRFSRSAGGTMRPAFTQGNVQGQIVSPNPPINWYLNTTVSTAQGSLAAGDFGLIRQGVENVYLVPLSGQTWSLSFLYNTNAAGTYYISLQDAAAATSYVTPFTAVGDSAWHLVTIPNIPVYTGNAGTGLALSSAQGSLGLLVNICLGAGSTFQTNTTNSWIAGNFYSGTNQLNFWNGASNFMNLTQFMLNPGSSCSAFSPVPFVDNLAQCQRYYCQAKAYGAAPFTGTQFGSVFSFMQAGLGAGYAPFPVSMASIPTVTLGCSGGTNQVSNLNSTNTRSSASAGSITNYGFDSISATGLVSGDIAVYAQFTASSEF